MEPCNRPPKLLSLSFYSPYQTYKGTRRLISEDRIRLTDKIAGIQQMHTTRPLSLINTCVRSFAWMYRTPGYRTTSFHEERSLGKERRTRVPPLSQTAKPSAETSKLVITRKPTITLRKALSIQDHKGELIENIANGILTFRSACIECGDKKIFLPFSSLKHVIFAPEGEVIYNLTQCLIEGEWSLGEGLYSNYNEVDEAYDQSFYLPAMQVCYVLVKSNAIQLKKLGEILKAFEVKGLTMKLSLLLEKGGGPVVVTSWEGSEAVIVSKKITESFGHQYFKLLAKEEFDVLITDPVPAAPIPSFTCKVNGEYISFTYPSIQHSNKLYPISLGLLKSFIETDFSNWADKFSKKIASASTPRRAGFEQSTLKSNVRVDENPCVLTLNSYELTISNSALEASFAFKISDMSLIHKHSGSELLQTLTKAAKLTQTVIRGRTQWNLSIDLEDFPQSKGLTPSEATVRISGEEYKCKFTLPSVELYKPHIGETSSFPLSSSEISKLVESNFESWESTALSHFTN